MEMTNCPDCGISVDADAPGGLCPKCLMQRGLDTIDAEKDDTRELPSPGEEFGGYRIIRALGSGGMGAVFEAEQISSGRHVALKILSQKLESPAHRQRFLREGRLAASINHPNTVYIYGTEEINGVPVIAMELATGGTLYDRLDELGQLPVAEAVDAILDVINGLEAAHEAGVLHRDIKPANCFIDAEGLIKVGDFGLSISTIPTCDTQITADGQFLGTPVFSSPEQLRGDELDVRSDIYSVGVTLYCLLTGELPFYAKHMVQLLATVLEKPAPSPRDCRSEIPQGLARVVQRALSKQSNHRYRDYSELREALTPYCSKAPTPGTVGFRILASCLDYVFLAILLIVLPLLWAPDAKSWIEDAWALIDPGPQPSSTLMLISIVGMVFQVGYFAVAEGIWAATPGKLICRLRVVAAGGRETDLPHALLRGLVFLVPGWLPWWVYYLIDSAGGVAAYAESNGLMVLLSTALVLLLFTTMRRRNGFAGIHELTSKTRVVSGRWFDVRPKLVAEDQTLPELKETAEIGPYEVLGPMRSTGQQIILAYDRRLLRRVWIRKCRADDPQWPRQQRDLSRVGRLRWLAGDRSAGEGWDAFEAPTGEPLGNLIASPQPWASVRFWIADLAEELDLARQDGTMPSVLGIDRVWITESGRAVLLDFSAPHIGREASAANGDDDAVPIRAGSFLKQVAACALEGRAVSAQEVEQGMIQSVLPPSARDELNALSRVSDDEIPAPRLRMFTQGPAQVRASQRIGVLAATLVIPLLLALICTTYLYLESALLLSNPEIGELSGWVAYYDSISASGADATATNQEIQSAIQVYVAHHFKDVIEDQKLWSDPSANGFVDLKGQELIRSFLAAHPDSSSDDVDAATAIVEPLMLSVDSMGWSIDEFPYTVSGLAIFLWTFYVGVFVFAAIPSLVLSPLFGVSPLLRMLDIRVVTGDGETASRLRVLWRQLVLWTIILIGLGMLTVLGLDLRPRLLALVILCSVTAIIAAKRGPQDIVAGTWLVPK